VRTTCYGLRVLDCPKAREIDAEIARIRSILAQARGPMPILEMEIAELERQAEALTMGDE
jgi:hypothetical protein